MRMLATVAFATFAFATPVLAAPTQCNYADLVRSVEVIYSDPGQDVPCEVLYDKPTEGQQLSPWRAENEQGYCESKAASLVEKLQSMGWACGVVAEAAMPMEGEMSTAPVEANEMPRMESDAATGPMAVIH